MEIKKTEPRPAQQPHGLTRFFAAFIAGMKWAKEQKEQREREKIEQKTEDVEYIEVK